MSSGRFPGATVLPFAAVRPDVSHAAFVAPGARLIGDVVLGEGATVWYNCVVRGDVDRIRIGARTNLQDGSVVHVTTRRHPTLIGDDCLIGHLALLHGCRIGDRAFIGMGAIVMDDCEVAAGGMLAAGALLTPGKRVGTGELWAGRPATFVRRLTLEEAERHAAQTAAYVELGRAHAAAIAAQSDGSEAVSAE